ncbi:hypothetical protein [Zoogloea sp.]|uniref:hypothetical protein n=1 Tax=Zoogloea sp. TaxID=49181 RepID=UPI0014162F05|nr:MAG: hypothetical protein F9K15_02480 [Zoogloea sp.]
MSTLIETLAALDSVISAEGTAETVKAALSAARVQAIKDEVERLQKQLKEVKALLPTKPLSPKQQALADKRAKAKADKEAAKKAAEEAAKAKK